jgi:hypothetical protein
MGLLDNIFGGGSGSAVPGGNVTKPLMIALLALLASRYMSGSCKAPDAQKAPTSPDAADEISPGTVAGESRRPTQAIPGCRIWGHRQILDWYWTERAGRSP